MRTARSLMAAARRAGSATVQCVPGSDTRAAALTGVVPRGPVVPCGKVA